MNPKRRAHFLLSPARWAVMEAMQAGGVGSPPLPDGFPKGTPSAVAVWLRDMVSCDGQIYSLLELPEQDFTAVRQRWTYVWDRPDSYETLIRLDGRERGIECWCQSEYVAVFQIGITIGMKGYELSEENPPNFT